MLYPLLASTWYCSNSRKGLEMEGLRNKNGGAGGGGSGGAMCRLQAAIST